MHRVTTAHVRRWHLHQGSVGRGHLYQGTYKSFPVEQDEHFYSVCRYAERNARRPNRVPRAEEWRWGNLAQSVHRQGVEETVTLSKWPVPRPRNWGTGWNWSTRCRRRRNCRRCEPRWREGILSVGRTGSVARQSNWAWSIRYDLEDARGSSKRFAATRGARMLDLSPFPPPEAHERRRDGCAFAGPLPPGTWPHISPIGRMAVARVLKRGEMLVHQTPQVRGLRIAWAVQR